MGRVANLPLPTLALFGVPSMGATAQVYQRAVAAKDGKGREIAAFLWAPEGASGRSFRLHFQNSGEIT